MTIPSVRMFSREMKTTMISIYSYEKRILRGTINNPFLKKSLYFENTMQLLLQIENLLDSMGFPQRAMELREGTKDGSRAEKSMPAAEVPLGKPIATFELEVIFRQNASWQGCLTYAEKDACYSFRSVLEMLFLMDDFLEELA